MSKLMDMVKCTLMGRAAAPDRIMKGEIRYPISDMASAETWRVELHIGVDTLIKRGVDIGQAKKASITLIKQKIYGEFRESLIKLHEAILLDNKGEALEIMGEIFKEVS